MMMQPTSSETITDREPVLIILGSSTIITGAGIALANAFDWINLTNEQTAAVVGFVAVLAAIGGSILRANVFSPASHRAALSAATPPEEQ